MSELAFDMNGDPIVLPAHAQCWRVRRFRSPGSRGAPEVVTTREGAPPLLPIDIGFLEFPEIVEHVPGRYRLDPIDDKRKIISNAPAAYMTIAEHPPRNGAGGAELGALADGPDSVLRELARANGPLIIPRQTRHPDAPHRRRPCSHDEPRGITRRSG